MNNSSNREVQYWKQFQHALVTHADNGDLDALRAVNRKLVNALIKRGQPRNHAELVARQELAQCHQAIIHRLQQDKDQLAETMQSFRASQDGLNAYAMTALSSESALSSQSALSSGATVTTKPEQPQRQGKGYSSPYGN
ncbi:hypothetical protein L2750_16440 [Shewanella submarina]|uniref:Flagellar protein FlgN n=1 Tax=Shewanella submarina TaxID=2016376 RepID=A0ABV7GC91_9GAMM|nr:hypothetical protein [Shewanella submarina]MCL1038719.1 hypothetical protein [Shewanella submarina]